jgi:hypothetical protein
VISYRREIWKVLADRFEAGPEGMAELLADPPEPGTPDWDRYERAFDLIAGQVCRRAGVEW